MANQTSSLNHEARAEAFSALSALAQAMSAPARLRILQFLSNRPATVEEIGARIEESIANTSQHLQKLKHAGFVSDVKSGVKRTYSLTDSGIIDTLIQFQEIAARMKPNVRAAEETLCPPELCPDLPLSHVLEEIRREKAILIDVRDEEEFKASPAPSALSLPLAEIKKSLGLLPKKKTIYAFCRGRYCSLANDVVRELRAKGYKAYRLREMSHEIEKAMAEKGN
ncbi:MAG: metalloregulator ArsR/SmtB family transcription factor [Bdellovibrionaceae bacterium]|nr:metalloregulator ArsR/SmtB family transcription factor [Pseudobdellovibrionaceae bacterium]